MQTHVVCSGPECFHSPSDMTVQPDIATATSTTTSNKQISNPTDQQTQYVSSLEIRDAPACTVRLPPNKSSSLKFWQTNQHDVHLFPVHLIGDSTRPTEIISIGLTDLLSHSSWAQKRYTEQGNSKTLEWKQPPPIPIVLPVRTDPSIVRKLVTAFYSRQLHLEDDAEPMLILAHAMKVRYSCIDVSVSTQSCQNV